YKRGWIRWEDKKPTHRYVGRVVDRFPLPVRDRLPEPELNGSKDDPWQETHSIVMRDLGVDDKDAPPNPQNGLCTYTTTSWGGRKALGRLLDAYVQQAKEHPGLMPVVYLGSFEKPNTRGGTTDNPLFTIVEWKEFGLGASPPGRKITATPVPQLTHESDSGDGDDGFGKPTIMSNGKETKPWDDEVPF